MFTFEELCGSDYDTTFAYWVLVERKPLPKNSASLDSLNSWMSYHYEVEEQAYKSRMLRTNKDLLPKFIRLIAPVTLAERWTPFAEASAALGKPLRAERGQGTHAPALGIWKPQFLGGCRAGDPSEHVRHFVFLLRLACSVALQEKGRIIIIGSPGWSYSSWRNRFFMMNPDTAVLMHEAGYLYTDRIAQ